MKKLFVFHAFGAMTTFLMTLSAQSQDKAKEKIISRASGKKIIPFRKETK